MKSIILKALNAQPEEGPRVFLLLAQGFVTGIFLATFDVGAVSIFLEHFTESTLAWAFVASGAVGIFLTYLYSIFQARLKFTTLVLGYLLVIAGTTALLWVGLRNFEDFEPVVFLAFVLALPFSYIGLLIFWGTFGRIFTLRQAKRIIGGIDTGQLLASIFALFVIGALIDNEVIISADLFLIALISLGGVVGFFVIIASKFQFKTETSGGTGRPKTFSMLKIFRHRYMRLMSAFVIVSIIAATFVDFTFLNVTQIQWKTPSELGAFIARFEATVVIFSFLFQTFVTDWIIENYGLKVALLINPFLIIILVVGASLTGLFLGYSVDTDANKFIWFFLAIAMTKLFIDSLKDALDGPSFKLYFLPIDSSIRFDVTTKIEGVVTAFAAMVAGLLLIAMDYMDLDLIIVTLVIIPLLAIWFFTTRLMHNNYTHTLQDTLSGINDKGDSTIGYHEEVTLEQAKKNSDSVYYSLKIMEKLEPETFENSLKKLQGGLPSQSRLSKYTTTKLGIIQPEVSKELAEQAAKDAISGGALSDDQLYDLSKSVRVQDRLESAILLRTVVSDNNIFVLLDLLRDISPSVRKEALRTARKVKRPEAWGVIAEMLGSPVFGNDAAAALYAGGDAVLPIIEISFHKSGQTQDALLRIVKIMSRLGSESSISHLWDKLDYPDRKIVREILVSLMEIKYHPNELQAARLNSMLDGEIGKTIWNLAALSELKEGEHNDGLKISLEAEIRSNYDFIYTFLSILYESGSVQLVRENVESGTSDGITYALELLDIFIAKDLKPKLFPLIDDIPIKDKLTKLQIYYPRVSYNELQTLNYIINRDPNQINRWTKACAMFSMRGHRAAKVNAGMIGHLFNPDLLLAESAAVLIESIDSKKLDEVLIRLPVDRRYYLKDKLKSMKSQALENYPMRFDRCRYLRSFAVFDEVQDFLLSQITDKLQIVRFPGHITIDQEKFRSKSPLILVEKGKVEIKGLDKKVVLNENEYYADFFLDNSKLADHTIESLADGVVYLLDVNDFLSVMTNFREAAKHVLEKLEQKQETIKEATT